MPRGVEERGPADVEVWAKTEKFRARRVYRVEAAPEAALGHERVAQLDRVARAVADLIDDCHAERRHLIAHGKRWSFGDVVTCQDGVLETHGRLGQLIDATRAVGGAPQRGVLWQALDDDARTREHVYIEAGIEIERLMDALDERRLAVITAGSSSGQSLAGVINTASHGSDFDLGPIPDMVRAIAIACPDGEVRWIEPSAGLTRDGAVATLLPCAALLRDDDAFAAALVTIGALGVVLAYVVEVRPAYAMWETVTELDWPTVRPLIAHGGAIFDRPPVWSGNAPLDPAATYRAVELLINPFRDPTTRERTVHVVRRAERAAPTPGHEGWRRADLAERIRNFVVQIGVLLRTISEDVDDYGPGVDRLLRTGREDTLGFAPVHRVLNYGNSRVERVWSVDVVLPTTGDAHLAFLDEVLAAFDALVAQDLKLAGFLALRFSRRSAAALAMQNDDGADPDVRFAQLELFLLQAPFDLDDLDLWREDALVQDGVRFYERFCAIAEQHRRRGVLRVHWGQMMPSRASFAPPEGAVRDRWRRGRDALVGDRPYLFANARMLEAGVVEPPPGFALDGVLPKGPGDALERGHHLALVGTGPIVGADGALHAVDAVGRVARRAAPGRWLAIRPDQAVDADACPAGRLLASRRRGGRACLIARDRDRRLRATVERHPGVFSGWDRVHRTRVGEPALVTTPAGLELFAVSGRGVERFREDGDDDWDRLDRLPGGEGMVGALAGARVNGRTLLLGRRADDGLETHHVGDGAWTDLGHESRREPALVALGARAVAVWLDPDGRVMGGAIGPSGALAGVAHASVERPGLSSTSRFHLDVDGGVVRVAFADADRRVRVWRLDPDAGWSGPARRYDLDALGTPLLVGDDLFVKVAHDIVVRRGI